MRKKTTKANEEKKKLNENNAKQFQIFGGMVKKSDGMCTKKKLGINEIIVYEWEKEQWRENETCLTLSSLVNDCLFRMWWETENECVLITFKLVVDFSEVLSHSFSSFLSESSFCLMHHHPNLIVVFGVFGFLLEHTDKEIQLLDKRWTNTIN